MFALADTINSHIIDVINAAPGGTFSPSIDITDRGDQRRSQETIDSARVLASREVIEAVASNPAHSYWPLLSELVTHQNDSIIQPHYGEIGIPRIKESTASSVFKEGIPKDRDEVEGVVYSHDTEPADFYGFPKAGVSYETALGTRPRPNKLWYSTSGGRILFSGSACKIPMIGKSEDVADELLFVSANVPVNLIPTVVKRAVGMLVKEGDNLFQLAAWLNQGAMSDLIEIKGGVLQVRPLNLSQIVERSQRIT